jgi:hypothetical protein
MANKPKPENYSQDRRGEATVVVTQAQMNYTKIRLLRVIQEKKVKISGGDSIGNCEKQKRRSHMNMLFESSCLPPLHF